ncbi:HU family DNA-binding protein [Ferrovum sp.]|jgi:DNA-binding protein HU-beta|uniref:HU family DNA-binding protein n=1 Tax=Ferrovum sp. TaxID=2609467 RepID=UPI0026279BCC|nr:HU family DNA-binding protein [Ferrovum sp.]
MNKTEFVATIAAKTGSSKLATAIIVDAVLDSITDTLASGQEVTFAGFGAFKAIPKPARNGRNPATGESIAIPATTAPKFVPSKGLKDAVAKKV